MSPPCHRPEKWKGIHTVSGPTRSVTSACTFSCAPVGERSQTRSPFLMPLPAAVVGLISTKASCCSSASHGLERVSSPPPSYSVRRPEVRISGNFSYSLSSTFFCWIDLYKVGTRQKAFLSSCDGYLATRSGRVL